MKTVELLKTTLKQNNNGLNNKTLLKNHVRLEKELNEIIEK